MVALSFWNVDVSLKNPFLRGFSKEVKTIGDHLRKKRIELGLLQKDVSSMLNVCEDTVMYWENNRAKPMIHHIPLIIEFLGYNPYIFEKTTLGGKIKCFRLQNGLSRKKMGAILRVDASTISSWEVNNSKPRQASLKKLQKIFNKSYR
jgi:DNA-binding transcriptional regulator YiaG